MNFIIFEYHFCLFQNATSFTKRENLPELWA